MPRLDTARDRLGLWTARFVVLGAFLGIPLGVWWVASPLIHTVPSSYQGLLSLMIVATLAFGGTSAVLVWKGLDDEP